MIENNDFVTRHFEGKPDMWELKPPFLVWLQALSLKFLGYNEIAARLPSFAFAILTVLLIIFFANKVTASILSGITASLILVSAFGFTAEHGVRYGDHEAVITFFSTGFVLFSYLFFDTQKSKYLIYCFIFLFLGWFTKSIVIFMFVPPLLIWALINKQFIHTIFNKYFLGALISLTILIASYYILRENKSPGYIKEVLENELLFRYIGKSEKYIYQNQYNYLYYILGLIKSRFVPYFSILLVSLIPVFLFKNFNYRRLILFLSINFTFFIIVISFGTKNFWYDLPIYPIMSLTLGILISQYYLLIKNNLLKLAFVLLFMSIIFIKYTEAYKNTFIPEQKENENWRALCYYIKENDKNLPKKLKIVQNGYFAPLQLYVRRAKIENKNYSLTKTLNLEKGDTFIVYDDSLKIKAIHLFNTKLLNEKYGCSLRFVEK
ncbi:MAG: glycosyltransferase family 39 protein [Bacteroidia bacterium]|nr:glycosyltransferase family 39 protein [Bacteroidia bacterium]